MQPGYIPNWSQPVQWIPSGERPSLISFSLAKKAIPLINRFKPLKTYGYNAKAYYCSDCKLVIAPTKKDAP